MTYTKAKKNILPLTGSCIMWFSRALQCTKFVASTWSSWPVHTLIEKHQHRPWLDPITTSKKSHPPRQRWLHSLSVGALLTRTPRRLPFEDTSIYWYYRHRISQDHQFYDAYTRKRTRCTGDQVGTPVAWTLEHSIPWTNDSHLNFPKERNRDLPGCSKAWGNHYDLERSSSSIRSLLYKGN